MDRRDGADSSLTRSAGILESRTFWRPSSRWKPTETQRRILESLFASGMRNKDREQIDQVTEVLQRHGPVEPKNVFYWFQNTASRNKLKKAGQEESSSQRPSLLPSKRSSDESSVQGQEVGSVARRNSSVDPSEIRTLDLFPLNPGI